MTIAGMTRLLLTLASTSSNVVGVLAILGNMILIAATLLAEIVARSYFEALHFINRVSTGILHSSMFGINIRIAER